MRLKKPAAVLSAAVLLSVAACGGGDGGNSGSSSSGDSSLDAGSLGNTGGGQNPDAKGPVQIEGAKEGGTITVMTNLGLTTPIDPSDIYFVDTNAIMSNLVTRSLTQYIYDEK